MRNLLSRAARGVPEQVKAKGEESAANEMVGEENLERDVKKTWKNVKKTWKYRKKGNKGRPGQRGCRMQAALWQQDGLPKDDVIPAQGFQENLHCANQPL